MADAVRKVVAILILGLGIGLLWAAGRSSPSGAEAAKDEVEGTIAAARERAASQDSRLKGAYSFERGGWVYVHLEGEPEAIGFQHGYLLATEIEDAFPAVQAGMTHATRRDWPFFRQVARELLWPKLDPEYQQELQGIAEGLNARSGSALDVYDIVALNSFEEVPDYYVPWLDKREKAANAPNLKSPATVVPSWPPAAGPRTAKSSWPTTTGPTT